MDAAIGSEAGMKRWIVKAGATSLDGLVQEDVSLPEPGTDEVRVRVHAVSLNYRDQIILGGAFGAAQADFIPVSDGAGEIDAVGATVDGWSVGDKVTGIYFRDWADGPPPGTSGWGLGSDGEDGMLAEYVILKASRITALPTTLSFAEAACLPCAGLTAWTALNGDRPYRRPIGKGDRVLVTGTGAVALFSILFARAAGAEAVATTSRDEKAAAVRALGAADVLNYRTEPNWGEAAAARHGGFDRVVNAAGGRSIDQAIAALAPGGEIALMGLFEQADAPPDLVGLMTKGGVIRGTSVGSAMACRDMVDFIDTHGIKPPVAQRFAFDQAPDAYRAAAAGEALGKIVIHVAGR